VISSGHVASFSAMESFWCDSEQLFEGEAVVIEWVPSIHRTFCECGLDVASDMGVKFFGDAFDADGIILREALV
jgi:hypothetical protein